MRHHFRSPAGLACHAVTPLEVPACPSSAVSPCTCSRPGILFGGQVSKAGGYREPPCLCSPQKQRGTNPFFLSPKRYHKPASGEATSPSPKNSKNFAPLLRCTLPSYGLMAWRRKPLKRLRWRTLGSSRDSSHLSRKGNPSRSRLSNVPSISSS